MMSAKFYGNLEDSICFYFLLRVSFSSALLRDTKSETFEEGSFVEVDISSCPVLYIAFSINFLVSTISFSSLRL